MQRYYDEFHILTYALDDAYQMAKVLHYLPNPADNIAYLIEDLSELIAGAELTNEERELLAPEAEHILDPVAYDISIIAEQDNLVACLKFIQGWRSSECCTVQAGFRWTQPYIFLRQVTRLIKWFRLNKEGTCMFIGENLTNLRIMRGYSRKQLSDMLGITEQAVWQYEHGYTAPKIQIINQLKEIFNVKSKYFYTNDPVVVSNEMVQSYCKSEKPTYIR